TVGDGMVCPEKGSIKVSADKASYQSGDTLKISVTENLAYGYDLYAALLMPDGNFVALKSPLTDSTQLKTENFNRLYQAGKWNTQRDIGRPLSVVDMVLTQDTLSQIKLPSGKYCLYAALIPEGEDLMISAEKGLIVLDGVCFEVE
ncbi:MAG: hypothetical protein HQK70_15710, partial [Desulfamplus sp.]|nr:hypothetical protein [Desulfamplus sp.]